MVNLFSPLQGDYASRSAELARQQKLAQMLEQMSQQEIPVSTAGGITAPVSPYGALAKALSSFGGAYLSGKSAADEAELKKSDQEMAQKVAQNLYVMPAGSRQPDVGMIDTKGIEGAGPSFAATGKLNLEDTATTPQQQLQMLAPLMAGGETSRSVYNAFMPGAIKQQSENITAERERAKPISIGANGVYDPVSGKIVGAPAPEPIKPPQTRTYKSGNVEVTEQFNPQTGQYERLATSPIRVAGDGNRQPPSGYRWNKMGDLEAIPGGPADPGNKQKPPSPSLIRLETDDLKDVQLAGGIISDMNSFAKKIDDGKLNLGVLSNLFSEAGLATGLASETAKEYGSFKAQLEKLRNDSLRLNKGTQTEGDAVRAWDELFKHLNDEGFVRKRIDEIVSINKRAQAQRIMLINERRSLGGYDPIDENKYLFQPSAYENKNYNSAADVAAAYKSGKISRDDAAAILKQKGWAN